MQLRGLGVGDLAKAVRTRGNPRCNAKIALHVVNILHGLLRSAAARRPSQAAVKGVQGRPRSLPSFSS
jgi:hypothetical protein